MSDNPIKIKPLEFNWDKSNIDKNWKKHQVDFKECEQAFQNKPLIIFEDKGHSGKEQRFVAYGKNNQERKLTLIFTIRRNKIRVISARDQNKNERKIYEKIQ